jgi:hypothetical protein
MRPVTVEAASQMSMGMGTLVKYVRPVTRPPETQTETHQSHSSRYARLEPKIPQ